MSSLNISSQAHIASQSVILGDVTIGADSSVFYYAVVRGDESSITIGRRSNIQDNSTVHVDYGFPTVIGDDVTVGHNCVIHGCTIGDASLIGMGSTIFKRCKDWKALPDRCRKSGYSEHSYSGWNAGYRKPGKVKKDLLLRKRSSQFIKILRIMLHYRLRSLNRISNLKYVH